ncbi:MAG: 3'-5' exonuclease [Actinomycetota bacterium]
MSVRAPEPPPRGWARRPWREVAFVSLDFEATGLDLRRDEVVSFGVVPVSGGRVQSRGALYREVRPSRDPSHASIRIHNLRPGDLAAAATSESALPTLSAALDRRYLLAWAAEIEIAFLSGLFAGSRRAWRRRTIDVMRLAKAADGLDGTNPSSYALEAVAARLDVPVDEPHHALDDALTTAQVFLVVAARLARHDVATPGRLARTARRGKVSRTVVRSKPEAGPETGPEAGKV